MIESTRREFFNTTASGLGALALGSLLTNDGVLSSAHAAASRPRPLAVRAPHFTAKAKSCIFLFMAGAPSQLDLFDPKPRLRELHGEKLPKEILDKARFAFIKPDTATLMGSPRNSNATANVAWSSAIFCHTSAAAPTTC